MIAVILISSAVFLVGPGGLEASLHTSTYLFLKAPFLISHLRQSLLCSPSAALPPLLPPTDLAVRMYILKKKKRTPQVINSISINILLMSSKHRQGELVQEILVMEGDVSGKSDRKREKGIVYSFPILCLSLTVLFFCVSPPLLRSLLARRNFYQQLRGAADAQRNYHRTLLLSQNSACPLVIKKHTEEYLEMNYSKWLFALNYSWGPGEGRFASQRCKYY